MFSHWSRPKPNASEGGWVTYSDLQEILLITLVVLTLHVQNCKSLLCSMFNELTCTRFTRLSSPCRKYLINPYNAIFLKSPGSKDIKTDISNCEIRKYTNTITQIQLMTKCQETYAIFLNSCLFKKVNNDNHKYPKSAYSLY